MPANSVNIIAFDIPFPANYGGTIDIFYKLKTLHKLGIEVVLHCFEYDKPRQKELEKYCKEVYYYPRKKGLRYQLSPLPYIVATRNDQQLLERLTGNSFPILFEGLHSCYFLDHPVLKNRKKIVRTHNVEHEYYTGLKKASKNLIRKIYYDIESRKLKKFESILQHARVILSISEDDQKHFSKLFSNVEFIPAFHPFNEIKSKPGSGEYFLYHGKLSVEENDRAALFLIEKVFSQVSNKLVIAGQNPGLNLIKAANNFPNVELIANPSSEKMDELIQNAQACVLPTFQSTGLKLKLLISLFSSRFVIVNTPMVQNTSLEELCEIADSPKEFIRQINKIALQQFNEEQLGTRKEKLRLFSNEVNGNKLRKIIESA